VATVLDQTLAAGWKSARWDGRDVHGRAVASGAYLAKLEMAGEILTRKVMVAR
jgi:hypothetical protein